MRAIELYNPRRGNLKNYARWHIRARIGRFLKQNRFPNITFSGRTPKGFGCVPLRGRISRDRPLTLEDLISFQAHQLHSSDTEYRDSVRTLALLVLKGIPNKDRRLVLKYFGICGCKRTAPLHHHNPRTLHELGRKSGVSRERIRRRLKGIFTMLTRSTEKPVQTISREWQNL